jgi:hypothetical protein
VRSDGHVAFEVGKVRDGRTLYEPRRVCRAQFVLSRALQSDVLHLSVVRYSASAGGTLPIGSTRRRVLNQSNPLESGELDCFQRATRLAAPDHLSLEHSIGASAGALSYYRQRCPITAIGTVPAWSMAASRPTTCAGASQGQGSHRRTEDLAAPQRLDRSKTTMNASGMLREPNEQGVLAKVRGGNRGQNQAPGECVCDFCAAAAKTDPSRCAGGLI